MNNDFCLFLSVDLFSLMPIHTYRTVKKGGYTKECRITWKRTSIGCVCVWRSRVQLKSCLIFNYIVSQSVNSFRSLLFLLVATIVCLLFTSTVIIHVFAYFYIAFCPQLSHTKEDRQKIPILVFHFVSVNFREREKRRFLLSIYYQ